MGVLGVSWRNATASTLARYSLPRSDRSAQLRALAAALEVDELVYLATCNRVELLVAGSAQVSMAEWRRRFYAHIEGHPPRAGEAERMIRAWDGEGATEHLFLVASGLDSARAGESEIAGQLRVAAAESQEAGLLGTTLRALLDDAFRVAKRVRPVTEGRIGRASLADVAVTCLRERLTQHPGAVALVGVSPMTDACAASLARDSVPMIVVNRTPARAAELAERADAPVRSLDEFRAQPDAVTAIVLATAATEPVFDHADLARISASAGRAPLIVDLGVPANVCAADAARLDITHLGMDEITARAELGRARAIDQLGEARALVDEALDERRRRQWEALVDPTIVELRRRFEARANDEVDRALQDELATLDAAERAALRRWTEGLVRRLAHVPTRGLRDLAGRSGPAAAAAFLGTSAPDLAAALRERAARTGTALSTAVDDEADA